MTEIIDITITKTVYSPTPSTVTHTTFSTATLTLKSSSLSSYAALSTNSIGQPKAPSTSTSISTSSFPLDTTSTFISSTLSSEISSSSSSTPWYQPVIPTSLPSGLPNNSSVWASGTNPAIYVAAGVGGFFLVMLAVLILWRIRVYQQQKEEATQAQVQSSPTTATSRSGFSWNGFFSWLPWRRRLSIRELDIIDDEKNLIANQHAIPPPPDFLTASDFQRREAFHARFGHRAIDIEKPEGIFQRREDVDTETSRFFAPYVHQEATPDGFQVRTEIRNPFQRYRSPRSIERSRWFSRKRHGSNGSTDP